MKFQKWLFMSVLGLASLIVVGCGLFDKDDDDDKEKTNTVTQTNTVTVTATQTISSTN